MRYLCLFHDPGQRVPHDLDAGGGHVVAAGAVEPGEHAVVRLRAGVVGLSPRPSERPMQPLVGFALLEARDLNEAIQLAARLPTAPDMLIDVCPVRPETTGTDAAPLPGRLYGELASWWPLLSPPEEYGEEAADLLARLTPDAHPHIAERPSLLELGSGGGSLASHLKRFFRLTLTDLSPAMLDVSRAVNPECEHLQGDMFTLRLGREFDVVLIHDAIQYAVTPALARAALRTAAIHCRPGGRVAVLPDATRESFEADTSHGGRDGPDGRGLRYLEWSWDPDPADDTILVDYAFVLRAADGTVTVEHDRHVEGLFARAEWLHWLGETGFEATAERDPWSRDVFLGTRRPANTSPEAAA